MRQRGWRATGLSLTIICQKQTREQWCSWEDLARSWRILLIMSTSRKYTRWWSWQNKNGEHLNWNFFMIHFRCTFMINRADYIEKSGDGRTGKKRNRLKAWEKRRRATDRSENKFFPLPINIGALFRCNARSWRSTGWADYKSRRPCKRRGWLPFDKLGFYYR